jgi:hypothetical protein
MGRTIIGIALLAMIVVVSALIAVGGMHSHAEKQSPIQLAGCINGECS